MVNTPVEGSRTLDRAYAALADPTRRALMVRLRAGDARISDLAAPLPMSFAAVSRHVGVLEEAGLIRREVRGREHWLSVRPEGLAPAEEWIREQSAFWAARVDALATLLEQRAEGTEPHAEGTEPRAAGEGRRGRREPA